MALDNKENVLTLIVRDNRFLHRAVSQGLSRTWESFWLLQGATDIESKNGLD